MIPREATAGPMPLVSACAWPTVVIGPPPSTRFQRAVAALSRVAPAVLAASSSTTVS